MMKEIFRYVVFAYLGDRDILRNLNEAKLIKEAAEKIGITVVSKNYKRSHSRWESLSILESTDRDNTINITLCTNRGSTIENEIDRLEKENKIRETNKKLKERILKEINRDVENTTE